jgi:mono/diheme cytochrome c family protein
MVATSDLNPSTISMKRVLKWLGMLVGLSVLVLIVFAVFVYFSSNAKLDKTYDVETTVQAVESDSSSVARGHHLAQIHGCFECHGDNLEGKLLMDAPPFARVAATNLTPGAGGVGSTYSSEDWERALRHGVSAGGTGLFPMMPSHAYANMNDADTGDLIAFLSQIEPVDNELPERALYPIGRMVLATGGLALIPERIDHDKPAPEVIAPSASVEYGRYLVNITCTDCHGADLRGGKHPDPDGPEGPDLAAAGGWTFDNFAAAMRTGVRPSGLPMDAKYMPWQSFRHMTDIELSAIYSYLKQLPPAQDSAAM